MITSESTFSAYGAKITQIYKKKIDLLAVPMPASKIAYNLILLYCFYATAYKTFVILLYCFESTAYKTFVILLYCFDATTYKTFVILLYCFESTAYKTFVILLYCFDTAAFDHALTSLLYFYLCGCTFRWRHNV